MEEEEESRPREDLDVDTEQKEAARERRREFVRGLRVWQDLKPRRVRALCARVGREKTDLTFEPGEVMTGVRPAVWLNDGWLEGALDGRTGLFHMKDVEYLD